VFANNQNSNRIIFFILIIIIYQSFFSVVYSQFTISENFRGNTVGSNISMGGSPSAYLTSGIDDANNDGWLRLTKFVNNQKGYAYISSKFPSTLGALIDFEYKIWRTNISENSGADGIGVFLFDASKSFSLGGYGGSLGYAPKTTTTTTTFGLNGGYIGIGIDEYGNFSNPTEGRVGGPGKKPNSIVLRSVTTNDLQTTNQYLIGVQLQASPTSNLNSVDYNTATITRPTDSEFYRRIKITVMPNAGKYDITVKWRTATNRPDSTILTYQTTEVPPDSLRIGFAASTGALYNYHEIRNLIVTTPGGVSVEKWVDKINAKVGNQLTYTVSVNNLTTSNIANLELSDTIKDGNGNTLILGNDYFNIDSISFINYGKVTNTVMGMTAGEPKTSGFTNPMNFNLNMEANSITTFKISGTIKNITQGGGLLTNVAAIDPSPTGILDEDKTNNISQVTSYILDADFTTNSAIDSDCANPDTGNTFLITVSNTGSENSIAGKTVTLTDTIPISLTVKNITATGWIISNSGNVYTFTRNEALNLGSSYPLIGIEFLPPASGTNAIINSVSIHYDGIEAVSDNNNSQVVLHPKPATSGIYHQ